jgi:hypothetical protein
VKLPPQTVLGGTRRGVGGEYSLEMLGGNPLSQDTSSINSRGGGSFEETNNTIQESLETHSKGKAFPILS